jgi:hypothetical protein
MEILASSTMAHLRRHADVAGTLASGICLIHCLLTPLAIGIFPSLLPWLPGDASFHRTLACGIVLLGTAAFVPGYRIHRRRSLLALIGFGIALILATAWCGEALPRPAELALSIPGSLMLVAAHLLNRSFCISCTACHSDDACRTTQL